jgi:hypothetical protein
MKEQVKILRAPRDGWLTDGAVQCRQRLMMSASQLRILKRAEWLNDGGAVKWIEITEASWWLPQNELK